MTSIGSYIPAFTLNGNASPLPIVATLMPKFMRSGAHCDLGLFSDSIGWNCKFKKVRAVSSASSLNTRNKELWKHHDTRWGTL